ncbi:MAG: hypothetical protein AABM42_02775 [Actinomycetota bacterium]
MPAATIEQSPKDTSSVFVTGGRHRNHAVRLAAATLGLLLAGWLAALAAGLIGFSPLPELTLPGTGSVRSAPAPPGQGPQPARERDASAHVSPIAPRPVRGGDQVSAAGSSAPGASGSGTGGAAGQAGSGGGGTGSTSPDSGGGAPQSQTTPPARGTASPASPGNQPSFTPPASGEKSASPPRGDSANAPGKTMSADPPGRATRAHSG